MQFLKRTFIAFFLFIGSFGTYFGQAPATKTPLEIAYDLYRAQKYSKALAIFKNDTDPNSPNYPLGLIIKGYVLLDSVSIDTGRFYFEKAEKALAKSNNGLAISKTIGGFARIYTKTFEWDKAVQSYMLMDSVARKYKLLREEAVATSNIGYAFHKLRKIPIAQRYSRMSIAISEKLNEPVLMNRAYYIVIQGFMILAEFNDKLNEIYGDSMLAILPSFDKCMTPGDTLELIQKYDLYAKANLLKKDIKKALHYDREILKIFTMAGSEEDIAKALSNIGTVYMSIKNFDSALVYLKKCEKFSRGEADYQGRANTFFDLAECYEGLGDFKKGYGYLEKYIEADAKFNEDKNLNLQRLREDFETKRTEEHIAAEKERTEALYQQKRNFYFYISGIIFLLLAFTAFFIYYRLKTNKEKEKRELQIQTQTAELSALKAQMNPHFIFNSLIAIQNYVYKHDPKDVANYISRFAKLMRMILENSRKESVTIESELNMLNYYLELQQLRFPDKFDYKIEVDPALEVESILIPPMLSQPFIENSIEHGLLNKQNGKGNLEIKFIQRDTLIELSIKDNGIGRENSGQIKQTSETKHQSLATTITDERLALLNKKSKQKFSVDIIDLKNSDGTSAGTEVILKMPEL